MSTTGTAPVGIFLVGAQRCGTTAWFDYLSSHPDVAAPRIKEPNHFTTDIPAARRVTNLADYHALYGPALAGGTRRGLDASTSYLYSTEAAAAIRRYNPEARIVVLLRPPEDFLPSLHAHLCRKGYETATRFEEAWQLQAPRLRGLALPAGCPHPVLLRYLHLARLGRQLARYTAHFPPEQIAVLDLADWRADPRGAYRALLEFLALPDDGRTHFPAVHESVRLRTPTLEAALRSPRRPAQLLRAGLRRLPAAQGLPWIERLRQLNRVPARWPPLGAALAAELRQTLAEDQALLQRLADPLRILRR